MQGPDFIFFLQDSKRRFWQINSAGEVVLNSNPYVLEFSPDGWQDIVIKNVRNRKYWAIDRSVSLAFKYVEDTAQILKHIFYEIGVEESVYLVICEQRLRYTAGVEYGYWYKQIFRSEIDLSTYNHAGAEVTCNTLEDGLAKHLKANENTIYELDLTEYVKLDGINLKSSLNFLGISQGHSATITTYNLSWLSFSYLTTDGTSPNLAGLSQTLEEWNSVSTHDDNRYLTNYFLEATGAVTFTLKGTITVMLSNGLSVELYVKNSNGTRTQLLILNTDNPATPNPFEKTETFTINQPITMADGEKLFLISEVTDSAFIAGAATGVYTEFNLSVEAEGTFRTTFAQFARPQYLFTQLIDKITDGEYTAETCPFFGDLQNSDKVFTSGDAIRGIENPKIKLSMAMFFEFFDTYHSVGIREKNKQVLFDRKEILTDTVNTISLGEISRLKVRLEKSFLFNELAIGYPDVKNETGMLNGKNEVNTTFNFSFGTTKTPAKLIKVSRVKTSCYDIENVRIEGSNKNTTDNRADNDVYAIHILNTLIPASGDDPAHYELNREYNDHVTGVDEVETVFNLAFSPKNCLNNNSSFIRSCLYKYDSKKLKFISADRNRAMIYNDGTTQIIEDADIVVGDMNDPFFTPVVIEVETGGSEDLLDSLDDNPIMGFDFDFEGNNYICISMENSINPGSNKKQTFQLLSHPDNDLTKLKNYFG